MEHTYQKGSFWERLLAYLIDNVLVLIPIFLVNTILTYLHLNFFYLNLLLPIDFLIIALYNVFLVARTGSTIGKKLLKLKVVDTEYLDVSLKKVLMREVLGKLISSASFGLGFVWVLKDKQKQALHDKVGKTYVVKLNKEGSLIPSEASRPKLFETVLFFVFSIPLFLLLIYFITYSTVGIPTQITGDMMEPTLKPGQYVLVRPPIFIKRSDIVVYNAVIDGKPVQFLQRVIALPNETIVLKNSEIYINGRRLAQSRVIPKGVKTKAGLFLQENRAIKLYYGFFILMGDNREASLDSRDMGAIPISAITGKASSCVWNCR